jgi:hypothetical protein
MVEQADRARIEIAPRKASFKELGNMLVEYEKKYGYSTVEFFRRYRSGELGDDDDLMMWAGIYHLYLTCHPVRQFMREETAA